MFLSPYVIEWQRLLSIVRKVDHLRMTLVRLEGFTLNHQAKANLEMALGDLESLLEKEINSLTCASIQHELRVKVEKDLASGILPTNAHTVL